MMDRDHGAENAIGLFGIDPGAGPRSIGTPWGCEIFLGEAARCLAGDREGVRTNGFRIHPAQRVASDRRVGFPRLILSLKR